VSMLRDSFAMARDLVRIVRRLHGDDLHAPGPLSDSFLERRMEIEVGHWWHRAKRHVVATALGAVPAQGPLLDVGCGGGAMLADAPLAPAFGVEASAGAALHANAVRPGGVVRAAGWALPVRDASLGCVLALDVVEHHAQPERMLAEAARVLRPGGVLVVTVPAYDWMWSYADHVLGHYRRYTRARLREDVRRAGFEVVRCTYFHSWLLAPAWAFRTVRGRVTSRPTPDDFPLPGPVNRALLAVCRAEARAVVRRDLPFGLSVLAVARKPAR
jgi:SAM-dependent methyltransferase